MKPTPTLSTATAEEIQTALLQLHNNLSVRKCKYDGKEFKPVRHWQEFCCNKCRLKYHAECKDLIIDEQQQTIAALRREIEELRFDLAKTTSSKQGIIE